MGDYELKNLEIARNIRNKVIHTLYNPSKDDAKIVVKNVLEVIRKIKCPLCKYKTFCGKYGDEECFWLNPVDAVIKSFEKAFENIELKNVRNSEAEICCYYEPLLTWIRLEATKEQIEIANKILQQLKNKFGIDRIIIKTGREHYIGHGCIKFTNKSIWYVRWISHDIKEYVEDDGELLEPYCKINEEIDEELLRDAKVMLDETESRHL